MVAGKKVDRVLMRQNNTCLVLTAIRTAGEMSRAQAAEATGMSIVTVGRIADELIERGVLREQEKDGGIGRPPRVLSLNEEHLLCPSVFLDRDCLYLGLVSPTGILRRQEVHPIPHMDFTPQQVLPWMSEHLRRFLAAYQDMGFQKTVGVVMPGILDIERGQLEFSANFRWRSVPVVSQLEQALPGYTFVVENDCKAVALAEHSFGACAGCRNLVVLNLSDGIGAAVILNGEIYRGRDNMAGEIGHITLNPAGKICECGKVGCLQTHLSLRAILAEAGTVYPNVTLPELLEHYQNGEPFAVGVIHQLISYTSIAINLLANTYAPDVLLLCGSLLRAHPLLPKLLAGSCRDNLNEHMKNTFQLKLESFGVNGALIGGGAAALQHILWAMCQ